jgi:hypothetical protein
MIIHNIQLLEPEQVLSPPSAARTDLQRSLGSIYEWCDKVIPHVTQRRATAGIAPFVSVDFTPERKTARNPARSRGKLSQKRILP